MCEALNERTPGGHDKRTALFNSGAEAVENAVKIARHVTGRQAVVVFDHAYHGRTNLTMALTAKNMPYRDRFGPFAPEVYRVPMSYPLRDPEGMTGEEAAARAIEQIERQVGAANVACVLIEPIQGEGGFVVPAPGFLPAVAEWAQERRGPVRGRRDPDRLLPHRDVVRLRARGGGARPHHHGQGPGRRDAAGRRHRPGRVDGRRAPGRSRRHLRRQPGGLRRRPGLHPDHGRGRTGRGGRPDRRGHRHLPARPAGGPSGHRRRPWPRGHDGHGVGPARDPRARRRGHPPHRRRPATGRAWWSCPAEATAT